MIFEEPKMEILMFDRNDLVAKSGCYHECYNETCNNECVGIDTGSGSCEEQNSPLNPPH